MTRSLHSKRSLRIFSNILTDGKPKGGFLRLISLVAEAYALYKKIRDSLNLPLRFTKHDMVEQEFFLLWENLLEIRKLMGDELREAGYDITLTRDGETTLNLLPEGLEGMPMEQTPVITKRPKLIRRIIKKE